MNLFFCDVGCAIDHDFFVDVMFVDTTFKTNRYNLICAPFVGLNQHNHLNCCLMHFWSPWRKSSRWSFFPDQCQTFLITELIIFSYS